MIKIVKSKLDDYLEFDSDDLFRNADLVRIFGGSIRDIIAGEKINDIDILVGSKSIGYVEHILSENGYIYLNDFAKRDLNEIYSKIQVISEPHTWVKGSKIVQLIRPRINKKVSNEYIKNYYDLLSNVDMSCCGVSYDGKKIYEDFPNSILHCLNKVFLINMGAKMYSFGRFSNRMYKMISRGWVEIESKELKEVERDLKIKKILN